MRPSSMMSASRAGTASCAIPRRPSGTRSGARAAARSTAARCGAAPRRSTHRQPASRARSSHWLRLGAPGCGSSYSARIAPQWLWPQTTMSRTPSLSTANSTAAGVPWSPSGESYGGTRLPTLRTTKRSPGPVPVKKIRHDPRVRAADEHVRGGWPSATSRRYSSRYFGKERFSKRARRFSRSSSTRFPATVPYPRRRDRRAFDAAALQAVRDEARGFHFLDEGGEVARAGPERPFGVAIAWSITMKRPSSSRRPGMRLASASSCCFTPAATSRCCASHGVDDAGEVGA